MAGEEIAKSLGWSTKCWALTSLMVMTAMLEFTSCAFGQQECGGLECGGCISDSPKNVWCSEGESDSTRCLLSTNLLSLASCEEDEPLAANTSNCAEDVATTTSCAGIIDDPKSSVAILKQDNLSDTVQVTPQVVEVKVRPGGSIKFNVTVKPSKNYPFDLYMLMDVSASLNQDVATLRGLAADILTTLNNLTNDFAIGFGTFVDKPVVPFTPAVDIMDPDGSCKGKLPECAPPHGYNHLLSMTSNTTAFQNILDNVMTSTSADILEGGLDAIVQAMVCPEVIGWRNDSVHMLLFITDAGYHSAGDGKLGMAVLPNDGKCRMEKSPLGDFYEYIGSTDYDYPSLNQVRVLAIETKTLLVFAVIEEARAVYDSLVSLINVGIATTISDNSNNILEVIETSYRTGRGAILFEHSILMNQPFDVSVLPVENCNMPVKDGCDGVSLDSEVVFEVTVSLTSCLQKTDKVILSIPSLGQQLEVLVDSVCQCGCETQPEIASEICNENGNLTCGLCGCEDGWFGCHCNCSGDPNVLMCPTNPNTGLPCSGEAQGSCSFESCLRECECEEGFIGSACECSENNCRASVNAEVCSGNGYCTCDGCQCNAGFSGTFCECNRGSCIQMGSDSVCSGVGECKCGNNPCVCSCDCPSTTTSQFCEEEVDLCEVYSDCVTCLVQSINCNTTCPNNTEHEFIDVIMDTFYEINGSSTETCTNTEECTYSYYVATENESTTLHIEMCPGPGFPYYWAIPVIVLGLVLLVGVVIIILVKIIITIHDHIEYKKFVTHMKTAERWERVENPRYVSPNQKFTNVAYKKKQ